MKSTVEDTPMKRIAERGFTLIEIMIVVAIIALLAAIAIPNVLRGRTSANEAAAIGNLRAVVSGLEMYRSVNTLYPLDIPANTWLLTMYGAGVATPAAACAVGAQPVPDFGPTPFCAALVGNLGAAPNDIVQGYVYTYAAGATAGQQYTVFGQPTNAGNTGTRAFFANESGQIRHCRCAAVGVPPACLATAAAAVAGAAGWVTIDLPLPAAVNCT
jgi:prepilin-type N-terminal cleavage/methylation domain-containing protein